MSRGVSTIDGTPFGSDGFRPCEGAETPQSLSLPIGTVAVFSARAPEKTTPNEDCAAVIPVQDEAAVLVVADGMGGQPGGRQASRLAVDALARSVRQAAVAGMPLRDAILDGFENANRAVSSLAIGAATTLAAVELNHDHARPYHVGDSMILLVGQRGRIKHRTVSHSPVGYAMAAGMLDAEEAMLHDERHLVSNMIGSPTMHIEVGPTLTLARYDTLVVASDGLFDNLFVDEVVDLVRKGPLTKAAKRLSEAALRRMTSASDEQPSKPDDLTFILFRRPRLARNR